MVDILFQEVYALTEPIILYVNYIPITMCIFFGFFLLCLSLKIMSTRMSTRKALLKAILRNFIDTFNSKSVSVFYGMAGSTS